MNFLQRIALLLLVFSLFACENDININADYEEVAVVYGLLDQNADTQFVKINKTFLDDNKNALELAKDPSRLNFDSSKLKVSLIEEKSNSEFFLSPILLPKASGIFTDEGNIIYYTDQKLQPNATYNLKIVKPDGTITSGRTTTVDTLFIKNPKLVNFQNLNRVIFVDRNGKISNYRFKFETGHNVAEFEVEMHFKYTELIGSDSFPRVVKVPLTRKYNPELVFGLEFVFEYDGLRFFDAIEKQVPATVNPTKKVIFDKNNIDIIVHAADKDYSFYRQLNGPIEGLAQTRPEYTNITNGYGLFASRLSMVGVSQIDDDTRIYLVNNYKDTRNFSYQ